MWGMEDGERRGWEGTKQEREGEGKKGEKSRRRREFSVVS